MSFDRVAPHYRWLETVVFGNQLQLARLAFLKEIEAPRRVLIVGEGNGRFLVEFVRAHPAATVDCIEASACMIALARKCVKGAQVRFIHSDLSEIDLLDAHYDLIITHFFLDCFGEKTLPSVIRKLAGAATFEARWLIADFHPPLHGWRRWRAQALIGIMYLFFRVGAGIEARRLVDYHPLLELHGFARFRELIAHNEMIRSELWRRLDKAPALQTCHPEPAQRGEGPPN